MPVATLPAADDVTVLDPPAVRVPEVELGEVRRVAQVVEAEPVGKLALVAPGGTPVVLPSSVHQLLREALDLMRQGESVSVMSAETELTTQQAADLLNVSRPYLIRLLEKGEIPFHKAGTHRRVLRADLMAYRTRRDQARRAGLRRMVREAEELGLYDQPEVPVDSLAHD